jgi:glycerol-3-phosphate cytidylyltransferase-like family protein
LIVGVTTDELVEKIKGKKPIYSFEERFAIVSSIKYVDRVVPQQTINEIEDYNNYKFDIIIKGDDWKGTAKWNELEEYFSKRGVKVIFFPYTINVSSSDIKKIIETKVQLSSG